MTVQIKGLVQYIFKDTATTNEFIKTLTQEALEVQEFSTCSESQAFSFGFTPFTDGGFTLESKEGLLFQVTTQYKKPKASQVKHLCKQKEKEFMETNLVEKIDSDTKAIIKEDVIKSLLPTTFPDDPQTVLMWIKGNVLTVSSASYKKAEELISEIRNYLGSFAVIPLKTIKDPLDVMAEMVLTKYNETITLGTQVELEPVEEGATMKFSKELVSNMDISKHIETKIDGVMTEISFVTKLELDYEGSVFKINDKLEYTGVKVSKEFTTGSKDEAAMLISIGEINSATEEVVKLMGGVIV